MSWLDDLSPTLASIGMSFVDELVKFGYHKVAGESTSDAAKEAIADLANKTLTAAIEKLQTELANREAIIEMPAQLQQLALAGEGVRAAFEARAAEQRTVPVLDLDVTEEPSEPDPAA